MIAGSNQKLRGDDVKKRIMTILLCSLCMLPVQANAAKNFKDVPSNHYAIEAIQWAENQKIATGSNNHFNPSKKVTEAQFTKMYAQFFKHDLIMKAEQSKLWSDTYYDGLVLYDLPLKGTTNMSARNQPITRGQVAQLIAHAHGKQSDLESAVQYMLDTGISTGQSNNGSNILEQYGADNMLTRAQAVTLLYRIQNKYGATLSAKRTNVLQDTNTILNAYDLGGEVTANVLTNDKNNFEVNFTINDREIIGGYIGGIKQSFEDIVIGQPYDGELLIEKNGKTIEVLTDYHNNDAVMGIYWHYNYKNAIKAIQAMENDTTKQKQIEEEKLYIEILNVSRMQHNVPRVTFNSKLMQVARNHSTDMYENNYYSHTSLNGQSPGDRIKATGLKCRTWGEIIATGYSTIFHAHNGWMNSLGHREISLDPAYEEVGIGIDHKLYTAVFFTGW